MEKKKTATSERFTASVLYSETKVLKRTRPSKSSLVLRHLESGKPITPLSALRLYHSLSLRDIIYTLRGRGLHIVTTIVKNEETGARFARYHLKAQSDE